MKKPDTTNTPDVITTLDRSGRRRFVRAGAAFLLAGATVVRAQEEGEGFRSDCDGVGGGGSKNPDDANSDSDTGASADRPGCGVRKVAPASVRYNESLSSRKHSRIDKIAD